MEATLQDADPAVYATVRAEIGRQKDDLELIGGQVAEHERLLETLLKSGKGLLRLIIMRRLELHLLVPVTECLSTDRLAGLAVLLLFLGGQLENVLV